MRLRILLFLVFVAITALVAIRFLSRGARRPENADPIVELTGDTGEAIAAARAVQYASTDWPQWRGSQGDGIAIEQTVPTTWSETENIAWKVDVPGRGHSSPILVGNLVVLATAIEGQEKQLVLAYDRGTGEKKWETQIHQGGFTPIEEMHAKSTHANGTLASDGTNFYVTFLNDGKIWATSLDLAGNIVWQNEAGGFYSRFGYAASPLIYKSLLLVVADNWGSGFIAGMDRDSGEVIWRKKRNSVTSFSSPLLATVAGKDQLVICGTEVVTSFDPATGDIHWATKATTEATCGTPVTDGKSFFASGGFPKAQTVALNGADGEVVWQNTAKVYEPSLLVTGGNVFAVTDKGIAYCWSAADGKEQWKKRLRGGFSASPVLCGDNIYVPNLSGETFVFKADGSAYQEVARNKIGDDCHSSFAIAGGDMVFRIGRGRGASRQEQLVCVRTDP